ncbi:MAG TPA: acetamidase/formamidase family protein [Candidatus Tectomicrobia bacterium]
MVSVKPGAVLRVECDDWTGGQIKNGDSANDICETCGPFERRRSLNEAGDPMACPTCLAVAQRMYSTLAHILTSAALRRGLEQQAEPKVVKRPTPNEPPPSQKLHQSAQSRLWQLGHAAQTRQANSRLQRM